MLIKFMYAILHIIRICSVINRNCNYYSSLIFVILKNKEHKIMDWEDTIFYMNENYIINNIIYILLFFYLLFTINKCLNYNNYNSIFWLHDF